MHKCSSYGLYKLNLWPIYHLTFKYDLDLSSTWTNVSNEQLCHINLKSMHKCRSYGPDMLNLWHFIIWPSTVTLTLHLPEQMFQMALLLLKENNCATLIWNQSINVEVMAGTTSIYVHFIIWPSTYLNKCFKWHCYSSKRTTAKLFWNPCINAEVMAPQAQYMRNDHLIIWPSFKGDLDLQPTWTNV